MFDAHELARLARFWGGVLGWEIVDHGDDGAALLPNDDTGFRIGFFPTQEQKAGQNQMHFDLTSTPSRTSSRWWRGRSDSVPGTSTSVNARTRTMWCSPTPRAMSSVSSSRATTSSPTADSSERSGRWFAGGRVLLERGAGLAVGLGPGRGDRDPLTARRSEGHVGWSAPDAEAGKNRLHFDLAPPADGDQQAEVDRLVSLGATRIDIGQGQVSWTAWPIPTATSSVSDPPLARPAKSHRAELPTTARVNWTSERLTSVPWSEMASQRPCSKVYVTVLMACRLNPGRSIRVR